MKIKVTDKLHLFFKSYRLTFIMDKIIKKGNIKDLKNDYKYWISRPYVERLKTIEEIRKEYNLWKYGTEQGFQRVFTVISKVQS